MENRSELAHMLNILKWLGIFGQFDYVLVPLLIYTGKKVVNNSHHYFFHLHTLLFTQTTARHISPSFPTSSHEPQAVQADAAALPLPLRHFGPSSQFLGDPKQDANITN